MLALAAATALATSSMFAGPVGPGFDCDKARAPDEKLVCDVPDLAELDRRMSVLWSWRVVMAAEDQREPERRAQRAWLKKRAACAAGPKAPAAQDARAACARALYKARVAELSRAVGPVPDAIVVVRRTHRASTTGCEDVQLSWPELESTELAGAGPLATYFADEHEPYCIDAADAPMDLYFRRSFELEWKDARFVTWRRWTEYSGGAHPNHSADVVTFDLERGSQVDAEDVFSSDPGLRRKLLAVLEKALAEKGSPDHDDLVKVAFEPGHWAFTDRGAMVHFSPYEIGSYSQGDFDVVLSWKQLRRFLRDGAEELLPIR